MNLSETERLAILETNLEFIKEQLSDIKSDVKRIDSHIARIDSRIDSLIKWVVPAMFGGLVAIAAIFKIL